MTRVYSSCRFEIDDKFNICPICGPKITFHKFKAKNTNFTQNVEEKLKKIPKFVQTVLLEASAKS